MDAQKQAQVDRLDALVGRVHVEERAVAREFRDEVRRDVLERSARHRDHRFDVRVLAEGGEFAALKVDGEVP